MQCSLLLVAERSPGAPRGLQPQLGLASGAVALSGQAGRQEEGVEFSCLSFPREDPVGRAAQPEALLTWPGAGSVLARA